MRSQFTTTVSKIIKDDHDAVLLLGDIGVYAFRDLFNLHPLRTYNIGVLEQSTISVAAGLSMCGFFPIVHTIAPFLVERALEQIKVDLCYQQLGCNLVSVGGSYDYAALGSTHHCPEDIGLLNEIPGIEIVVPGHRSEFDTLFRSNYRNASTTYYRLSESSNNSAFKVEFKKNTIIKEGKDLVIIAVGPVLKTVLEAVSDLDATIVYCTTIKPFDFDSISKFMNKKILIVEPYYTGAILTNIMRHKGILSGRFMNIGVPNNFIRKYGSKNEIDNLIGLDPQSIRTIVLDKINEKS